MQILTFIFNAWMALSTCICIYWTLRIFGMWMAWNNPHPEDTMDDKNVQYDADVTRRAEDLGQDLYTIDVGNHEGEGRLLVQGILDDEESAAFRRILAFRVEHKRFPDGLLSCC